MARAKPVKKANVPATDAQAYIPMMRRNIPMNSAVRPLPSDMCISVLVSYGLEDASQVVIVTSVERGLRVPLARAFVEQAL
jgi:hypothetical protein